MSRMPHTLRLVSPVKKTSLAQMDIPQDNYTPVFGARQLGDKAQLLRPLKDEHLLEVYREAKKMNLSAEFIELLEDAIEMRQLEHRLKA